MEHKPTGRRALWLLAGLLLMAGCGPVSHPVPPAGSAPASPSAGKDSPAPSFTASPSPSPRSSPTPTPTPSPSPVPQWKALGFVDVTEVVGDALVEVRYYSSYNFVGEPIDGYEAPRILLTFQAARALAEAARALAGQGYLLKLYDGYRPQRAVDHFIRWAQDAQDQRMKDIFYPDVEKSRVFELGYLARRSGHSRGSTVDLTLVDSATGQTADMGGPFDFFGEISHHGTPLITAEQAARRALLRGAMEAAGFKAYRREWWHYTLVQEPYPDTYFDFPIA